jgi:hypothetical protein
MILLEKKYETFLIRENLYLRKPIAKEDKIRKYLI